MFIVLTLWSPYWAEKQYAALLKSHKRVTCDSNWRERWVLAQKTLYDAEPRMAINFYLVLAILHTHTHTHKPPWDLNHSQPLD